LEEVVAEVDHFLGVQPQIAIDGTYYYVRSGSPEHTPVNKGVESEYTVGCTGIHRRRVAITPREWDYIIACRGTFERDTILGLVNNMTGESYVHTFYDGITGATYNVVALEISQVKPVSNNFDYWDVSITLREWT